MHPHHALPPSPHERSLSRDRAILALASALCGAIAAAGVAAVAIAGQLHTRQQQTAMSQATDALQTATHRLEDARQELADARAAAQTPAPPPALAACPRPHAIDRVEDAAVITHVGITCPEEHVCQIHRELITDAIENPGTLARAGRVVQVVRDGEPMGFKVYAIRAGSVLKLLGLRNGDRIDAVDGVPLRSHEQSLQILRGLREGQRVLEVDLERKGVMLRKRFEIL
ncbi:MAG: PDZ domain-containing protein [Nannocystaceae bacterium]